MPVIDQREVIVEYECVQIIRKRAKTHLMACTLCGRKTDFVSLEQAVQLFETAECSLLRFITENSCHFQTSSAGKLHICLAVLLRKMQERKSSEQLTPATSGQLNK